MADFLKDKRMEIAKRLSDFADESLEVYDRNKRYEPSRETDKYILDRMLENTPVKWRPRDLVLSGNPSGTKYGPLTEDGEEPAPLSEGFLYLQPRDRTEDDALNLSKAERVALFYAPHKSYGLGKYYSSKRSKLEGWEAYKKDLETFHNKYKTDRKAWNEAVARLQEAGKLVRGGRAPDTLTAAEEQQIQDLQNEVVADMAAPGAQEDRPGRLQEIIEALDLSDPDSGGRAFLRELKRKMVDDKVPKIQAGWQTQSGEDALKDKLVEMELADTPRNRATAMQALGWKGIPKEVRIKDDLGKPVPLYVEDMRKAREAAAEKAYMQHRRDPMKDTPERD